MGPGGRGALAVPPGYLVNRNGPGPVGAALVQWGVFERLVLLVTDGARADSAAAEPEPEPELSAVELEACTNPAEAVVKAE